MTKHTAEPWERRGQSVYQEDDGTPGKAKHVAECHGVEDSARIAACVNACAGISTQQLEAFAFAMNPGSDSPFDRLAFKEAWRKLRGEG